MSFEQKDINIKGGLWWGNQQERRGGKESIMGDKNGRSTQYTCTKI
jgi:hypothetical protein